MPGSDDHEQFRFGENGELEEPDDEDNDGPTLRDDGKPIGRFQTKGGYNMFLVSSCLQKAVRRSDAELAAWSAWELTRSGYEGHVFKRLNVIALEDTASHDPVALLVHRYEEMAGEYGPKEWAAMEAAMALARAESSREADWARVWFEAVAEERVKDDADEKYQFPTIPPEARDKHTQEGSRLGRDMAHFVLNSSRVTDESELGQKWKRRIIEHEGFTDDEEAIEQAVANVEPGEHDDPPEDQNQSLSECRTGSSDA
jgi:replication-associated recombination protein RarA